MSSSSCTFLMLHFFRFALFSCCTFFILYSFHITLFFMLLVSRVALFSCCSFSVLHYFLDSFLCSAISFFVLHSFYVALSCMNFYSEQVFRRKLRSDCLFFKICVILKFYEIPDCDIAPFVNLLQIQMECFCLANML